MLVFSQSWKVSKKSNLLLKILIEERVLITVQGISGILLAAIINLAFVTGGGMSNSTSLSITSCQLLVHLSSGNGSGKKYIEELKQCQFFKVGSKGSKNISKARKYSWYLMPAQSPLKLLGYLWSTAEPTQSRAERGEAERERRGGCGAAGRILA